MNDARPKEAADTLLDELLRRMLQGLEEITPQLWQELFEEHPDKAISFLNACLAAAKFMKEQSAEKHKEAALQQRSGGLSEGAQENIEQQLQLL